MAWLEHGWVITCPIKWWWNFLSIPKLQWLHHWNLRMDTRYHPTLYNGCSYVSTLGLNLTHAGKKGPTWLHYFRCIIWYDKQRQGPTPTHIPPHSHKTSYVLANVRGRQPVVCWWWWVSLLTTKTSYVKFSAWALHVDCTRLGCFEVRYNGCEETIVAC